MISIEAYLKRIEPLVRAQEDQVIDVLSGYRSPTFRIFPILDKFFTQFPVSISRREVISLFDHDPYFAAVVAMIWGGIDCRMKKDLKLTNFYRFLDTPSDRIHYVLNEVSELCKAREFREAFIQCSKGGSLKLEGLDYPYFTKLFYFLGQSDDQISPSPLILDKWTTNAFFVLLKLEGTVDTEYIGKFQYPEKVGSPGLVRLRGGVRKKADTYELFVNKMHQWSSSIGVTSSQLEQYLFGFSRKSKEQRNSPDNPRNNIWTLISGN